MNKQNLTTVILITLLLILIGVTMLMLKRHYQRMQEDCKTLGGKFYSISFTQNICVDGTTVHHLE